MAMSSSNPSVYLDQWLATASKGSIVPHYAVFTNRVKLICTICAETLTIDVPKDTTIDFKIQSFVNFHLHWPAPNCSYCGAAVTSEAFVQHEHLCLQRPGSPGYTGAKDAYGVTLDFKPVTMSCAKCGGVYYGPHTCPKGKIDDNVEKAKLIVQATEKTMQDYGDAAVAKKLATLMAEDQGKVIPPGKVIPIDNPPMKLKWQKYEQGLDPSGVVKGGTSTVMLWKNPWPNDETAETASDEELADLEKKAAKLKAIENALKIKQLKAMIETLTPLAEHEKPQPKPTPTPTPIADGVLVTGRKFR